MKAALSSHHVRHDVKFLRMQPNHHFENIFFYRVVAIKTDDSDRRNYVSGLSYKIAYEHDRECNIRFLAKLHKDGINPKGTNKMKVSECYYAIHQQ